MRQLSIALSVICLITVFNPACAPEPARETKEVMDTEADVKAIERLQADIEIGLESGDAVKLGALVADDIIFLPPNQPALIGKQEVMSWTEEFLNQFTVAEFDWSSDEVVVAGDWAYYRIAFSWTLVPKEEGEPIKDAGKSIVICRRQPDGSWKWIRDIWNSNQSPSQQ